MATDAQIQLQKRLQRSVLYHQAGEEPGLQRYRDIADTTDDPMVRMILHEIIADEERHHEVMAKLLRRLGAEVGGEDSTSEFPTDPPTSATPEARANILELKELARHERDGVRQLQALATEYRTLFSGLPSLLLNAIAQDSRKHDHLLRFVVGRLNGGLKASPSAGARSPR